MHQRLSEQVILIGLLWMRKIFLLVHLYFVHLYYEQNSILPSSTPCLHHPSITSRFKHLVFLHPDHLFHPASIMLALIDISSGLEKRFERQPVDIDIREERSNVVETPWNKALYWQCWWWEQCTFCFSPLLQQLLSVIHNFGKRNDNNVFSFPPGLILS